MTLLLLLAVIMLSCTWLAMPLFEATFIVTLLTPLGWFLIGKILLFLGAQLPEGRESFGIFVLVATSIIGAGYYIAGIRKSYRSIEEYSPFFVFLSLFCFTLYYATAWPDFIAMGERLRDYAILASTISSPVEAVEPWMSGTVLNYYVYWYRFGHFLSVILQLEIWDIYPLMTAFAMAFYGAAIFEVARVVGGLSIFISAMTGFIAALGSNVAGIIAAYSRDSNWWGPSRVVKGAINEFPAWSFILGDLHPHFLNLGLLPLLLLCTFRCCRARELKNIAHTAALFLVPVGVLWMFAANAWEVPLWIGVLACVTGSGLMLNLSSFKRWLKRFSVLYGVGPVVKTVGLLMVVAIVVTFAAISAKNAPPAILGTALLLTIGGAIVVFPFKRQILQFFTNNYSLKDPRLLTLVGIGVFVCISLKLSGGHIIPEGGQLSRVVSPIPLTRTSELLLHWGLPLSFVCVGSICLLPRISEKLVATMLLLGSLVFDQSISFLMVLFGLQASRLLASSKRPSDKNVGMFFSEGLVVASILFLLLPEAFFLNDAYGGENERMNTIFKVYNTAWGIITIAAASIFTRGVLAISSFSIFGENTGSVIRWSGGALGAGALATSTLFFFHAASLRMPSPQIAVVEPRSEGLSELQQRFPGSVSVIRRLREEPRGVVLEAQGNAYDYTTFVSTLAGHSAYLGWANHINLLTKRFTDKPVGQSVSDEVFRREQATQTIYSTTDCQIRKNLAEKEHISFIVLGAREKEKYPAVMNADFSCLAPILTEGDYALYRVF